MYLEVNDLAELFACDEILADMQVSLKKYDRLVRAIAPSGNLFFLLTIGELRKQGLTFLAFYVLQRVVGELEISEYWLRRETGLPNYEISRACKFLADSGLVNVRKFSEDARVRVLKATARGRRVHDQVLSAAALQFQEGVPAPGRLRRLSEATQLLRKGNRVLLGPLQLSFFDVDLFEQERGGVRRMRARKQDS
jgi:DNA-binding MarR family transcriptional regulator